jgi:crossover junction endodeoxyribonuclease RuvC
MNRVVGVDPGFGGGLALLRDGELVHAVPMPVMEVKGRTSLDLVGIHGLLLAWAPQQAVMERVGPAPGQGISSTFRFGYGAGLVHGLLVGLDVPVLLVAPTVWKPAMRLAGGKEGKAMARAQATRLWPHRATSFARVKDDGPAEAALIAHWHVLSEAARVRAKV